MNFSVRIKFITVILLESDRDLQVQDGGHVLYLGVGDDRLDGGEVGLRAGREHHRAWRGAERVSVSRRLLQDHPLHGAYTAQPRGCDHPIIAHRRHVA